MRAVLVVLAACGGKADPFLETGSATEPAKPTAAESPKDAGGSGEPVKAAQEDVTTEWIPVDGVSKSSPIDGDPTLTVVERAFRNQRPAFPLLSKGGEIAVVDLKTRSNAKGWLTYTVEYLGVNAAKPVERIPIIDEPLMNLLATERDASKIPITQIKRITKAARGINNRMHEEGFERFEGEVEKVGKGARAGAFQISVVSEDELVVKVARDAWQAETPKLDAMPMPSVGSIDCVAHPTLRRVFFDNKRKRVLVHVAWETGADQCSLPDDRYFLLGP